MERHYTLVNDCIDVLQEKNIGPIHTLCFKVQLSKLKQLLLERDLDEATGNQPDGLASGFGVVIWPLLRGMRFVLQRLRR